MSTFYFADTEHRGVNTVTVNLRNYLSSSSDEIITTQEITNSNVFAKKWSTELHWRLYRIGQEMKNSAMKLSVGHWRHQKMTRNSNCSSVDILPWRNENLYNYIDLNMSAFQV